MIELGRERRKNGERVEEEMRIMFSLSRLGENMMRG
jgi:hypothetical protein